MSKGEISGRVGGERYKVEVEVEVAVAVAVALGLLLSPGSSFVRGSSAAGRNHIADAKNMSFFSYQNIKVIVLLIDWY